MDISELDELKEITDPQKIVGFSVFATKDQRLATSDIDLAAFLYMQGIKFCGTLTRKFRSRGREKIKIFLVFPMGEDLDNALDRWDDNEDGGKFRSFRYIHRHLMGIINDTKDLSNE